MFEHAESPSPSPLNMLQSVSMSLTNIAKLLFYAIVIGLIVYFAWTRRETLLRGMSDILRQLREFWARLFGGGATAAASDDSAATVAVRRRAFREFTDPFATGRHRNMAPAELVRYTFEAFEAWCGDRGRPRTPDQTPQELVRGALAPQTPMYAQARQLAQIYSEAAYSAGNVSREAAAGLQGLWQMMRANAGPPREQAG
jgi:hypothetical protein